MVATSFRLEVLHKLNKRLASDENDPFNVAKLEKDIKGDMAVRYELNLNRRVLSKSNFLAAKQQLYTLESD